MKWEKTLRNLLGDSLSTVTLLAYAKEADLNKGDTVAYLVKAGQWADLVIQKERIYSWPTEFLLHYIKELEASAQAKGVEYEDFLQRERKANPELIASLVDAYSYVSDKEPYFQRDVYNGLNSLAWHIYTHSDSEESLKKALVWAKNSVSYDEHAFNMDTYAQLLYHFNHYDEAMEWMEKAVEKAKEEEERRLVSYEVTLRKMKAKEKLR